MYPLPASRGLVYVHALTMFVSYGCIFPCGILIAVHLRKVNSKAYMYHVVTQISGTLLAIIGMSIAIYKFQAILKPTPHCNIGLLVVIMTLLQILFAILRPSPGLSKYRKLWYIVHNTTGILIIVASAACNLEGFKAFNSKHGTHIQFLYIPCVIYYIFLVLLYSYVSRKRTIEIQDTKQVQPA